MPTIFASLPLEVRRKIYALVLPTTGYSVTLSHPPNRHPTPSIRVQSATITLSDHDLLTTAYISPKAILNPLAAVWPTNDFGLRDTCAYLFHDSDRPTILLAYDPISVYLNERSADFAVQLPTYGSGKAVGDLYATKSFMLSRLTAVSFAVEACSRTYDFATIRGIANQLADTSLCPSLSTVNLTIRAFGPLCKVIDPLCWARNGFLPLDRPLGCRFRVHWIWKIVDCVSGSIDAGEEESGFYDFSNFTFGQIAVWERSRAKNARGRCKTHGEGR